jgi:MOSC domain-containing protein YiiM
VGRSADLPERGETTLSIVVAVSRSNSHSFTKSGEPIIRLVAGLGVEGDAHLGEKTQHLFQARRFPDAPNLRQVHLIHEELFDELRAVGFDLTPGAIGENVTTRGVDLLGLPKGTRLRLGTHAIVELTGLRHPCRQLDDFARGLTAALLERTPEGGRMSKAGVMAIVVQGGEVNAGDAVEVELPPGERHPLEPV